jgi:hypothetical protein
MRGRAPPTPMRMWGGVPVWPVRARGVGDVRKLVLGGASKSERVVSSGGAVVQGDAPSDDAPSDTSGGNQPKKGENSPKAAPPQPSGGPPQGGTPIKEKAPPKQYKVVPTPLVEVERKPTPKAKEPVMQVVITPAQRELVEELERMQEHDPDIVPQQGSGWSRILKSKTGQPIGTIPVANPTPAPSPKLSQLMAEMTYEKLDMNTLSLLRRVALNPTVPMWYTMSRTRSNTCARR